MDVAKSVVDARDSSWLSTTIATVSPKVLVW